MLESKVKPALADMTFRVVDRLTNAYHRLSLPVISTGRSFCYYRNIFFDGQSADAVLRQLQGRCILDIGCGLTPYVSNSMFQACHKADIEFYGIDPKLADGFRFGSFDRMKARATGGGRINPHAPGLEKGIGTRADSLPFQDQSVDLILSCYLLYAWIGDDANLERIFREFHRVLKPGATIKIFPAPYFDAGRIIAPELKQILQTFDVEQKFLTNILHKTRFPPAYMRTLRKQVDSYD